MKYFIVSIVFSLLGLPIVATAQEDAAQTELRGICASMDTLEDRVISRLGDRQASEANRSEARIDRREDRRVEYLSRLGSKRSGWDENREQRYTRLDDLAETPEQVAAVDTFESRVESAVQTRRAAIDQAIETYHDAVDQLEAQRQSVIEQASNELDAAVRSAFDAAKASCDAGGNNQEIFAALRTDLSEAREGFRRQTSQGFEDLKSAFDAAQSTRNAAVDEAIASFKSSFESLKAELQSVFQ